MASLLKRREAQPKKKVTERGELLRYFARKIDRKIPYVAFKLTSIPTQDFYFIKSTCDDYERRGGNWSKAFFGSLKTPTNES